MYTLTHMSPPGDECLLSTETTLSSFKHISVHFKCTVYVPTYLCIVIVNVTTAAAAKTK